MATSTQVSKRAVGQNIVHLVERILYTDLTAAAATETLTGATLPAGAEILVAFIDNVVAMTDAGSISAVTIQVGSTNDANSLVTAFDLFGSTGRVRQDGVGETFSSVQLEYLFTATGANLGDGTDTGLDTGIVDVHIVYQVY